MARAIASSFTRFFTMPQRFLHSTTATSYDFKRKRLELRQILSPSYLFDILESLTPETRFHKLRCRVNHAIDAAPSLIGQFGPFPLHEEPKPISIVPGRDPYHWLIVMEPRTEVATKQEIIDSFIHNFASIIGCVKEAKKRIYSVHFDSEHLDKYHGFGCEVDEETAFNMEVKLPGVWFFIADIYEDPEHKDYGGELFVNGEIVQRPPERQEKLNNLPNMNEQFNNRFWHKNLL